MSNLKNQTQDLFAIDAMQDLDNESAAAVSGGQIAEVTLNSGSQQQGRKLGTNSAISDLSVYNFNNITSSVAVSNNQTWRFYALPNFQGDYEDVGPDEARDLAELNNRVSSLRSIT